MTQKKYTDGNGVSEMWLNIKNWVTSQLLGYSQTGHTHSASDITSGLATVATSGSYNDLTNKPTIPTVNNATLTIQKNGTTVKTFTANASSNVTANITVPTKTSELTNDSCIPLSGTNSITGTGFFKSTSDSQLQIGSGTSTTTGGCFVAYGSEYSNTDLAGSFRLRARKTSNYDLLGKDDGTLTWGSKNVAMAEDVVPRSGGAVMTSNVLGRTVNNEFLMLRGGTAYNNGAQIVVRGKDAEGTIAGTVNMHPSRGSDLDPKDMFLYPNGTWTWTGTACQITSDQRFKQQISEIDDKLLDAWEDVDLVQFKYNDAVDEKGDKARLHTGYVVQQIDNACKEHGVDVSQYGLFCHVEYPEETEEVEVEQKDGTKTKERKVIREASEHYSLRYTEALIVECKYLRRCIAKLTARIEELEKGNNSK